MFIYGVGEISEISRALFMRSLMELHLKGAATKFFRDQLDDDRLTSDC